jgi:DNA polymerase II small subunit/DNA polymerase delta subunit B
VGDWHVGNYDFNHAALKEYFKYAKGQGVDTFYHTGDLIDGHKVYKGQEFEVQDVGIARQVERCLEVEVPGDLNFITGNHDASFKNLAGCDVGKAIENERDNWHFLGEDQADVVYNTPHGEYVLRLLHPGGGSAYAISYKLQKIIESIEGGAKPNMIAAGHFHKAELIPSYRNVTGIQTGTFERQTPFMAKNGLAAHVGGWIVEVTVNERSNIIKPEFVAFY